MDKILKLHILLKIFFVIFKTVNGAVLSDAEILSSVQQRVLLITIDGFRADYIKEYSLSNFERFILHGVYSRYLVSAYPALSIPSFWSMATGVHVEKHGIVSNNFYDPVISRKFDYQDFSYNRLRLWSNYDPIWVDAVKAKLKTSLLFWPKPNEILYDPFLKSDNENKNHKSISLNEKIDIAIDLFRNANFKFVVINHNQPSMSAFKHGIGGSLFNETLQGLDQSIEYLFRKLAQNFMLDASSDFNVIILSNYGMINIKEYVILDSYVKNFEAEIWSETNTLYHLKPLINTNKLMKKLKSIPGVKVYQKDKIPQNLYYKNSSRIGDIIIQANEGVALLHLRNKMIINGTDEHQEGYEKFIKNSAKANNGFSKYLKDMAGMFMAIGPSFKSNYTFTKSYLKSIDVKPLICKVLKVPCEYKNMDGSLDNVKEFLNFIKPEKKVDMFSNNYEHNYIYKAYLILFYVFSVIAPIFVTIFNIRKIKYQLWQNIELEGETVDNYIKDEYEEDSSSIIEVKSEEPKREEKEDELYITKNDQELDSLNNSNSSRVEDKNIQHKKSITTEHEIPVENSTIFI